MANSKIIFGGDVLIDLTQDTVTADKLAKDITAHGKDGELITGTNTYDADTSDANAVAGEILDTKTAYVNGLKVTGTMPNNGAVSGTISEKDTPYVVPQGYHDGSGVVSISDVEKAKLIAANIRKDVEILGVTGTLEPEIPVTAQSKTVSATKEPQTVLPDTGYDYLSQVTVSIPYTSTPNPQGGNTVTIA